MATNKELLFNLVKKLESGEIKFLASDNSPTTIRITLYENGRKLESEEEFTKEIEIGNLELKERKGTLPLIKSLDYQEDWNQEFKENFYKEKGLDKCWVKDCPNKIYQKEGDYKKVKIPCQDKHTRMICLECSKNYE